MEAVKINEALDHAHKTLAAIDELKGCRAFTGYFVPRLERMRDVLATAVLSGEHTAEQREAKRQRYLQLVEVLGVLATDEAGQKSVLGINGGR